MAAIADSIVVPACARPLLRAVLVEELARIEWHRRTESKHCVGLHDALECYASRIADIIEQLKGD